MTMDDDLQNPPEEVPKLGPGPAEGDLDLVYGSYGEKQHSGWRNLGSSSGQYLLSDHLPKPGDRHLFPRSPGPVVGKIFTYNLNFTFVDGLLAWNTQRIGQRSGRAPAAHRGPVEL